MQPELARKMQRAIWRYRLRSYGPTAALVALFVVLGGFVISYRFDRVDPTVGLTQFAGTILQAQRVAGRAAIFIAHVRLDDGREVDADSTLATVLEPTKRVIVSEARHASGKTSFHVLQVVN